jgi:hypothetical protein
MKIEWKKRSETRRSELAQTLEKLMHSVVINQVQEINSKIESLCQMGVIKDGPQIQELREKMKQLQLGMNNESIKT